MQSKLHYLGIPIRKEERESLEEYLQRILTYVKKEPNYDLYVLPEYTWGSEPIDDQELEDWLDVWEYDSMIILGTALVVREGATYNTILAYDRAGGLRRIAKKYPVLYEQEHRGVVIPNSIPQGYTGNVIEFGEIKIGLGACSDMWQSGFIKEMIEEGADLIVISSMTVTQPDLRRYAQVQWYSLAVVRSREFVVPVIIVDSMYEDNEKITGRVTCSVDPSLKHSGLQEISDFLVFPREDGLLRGIFDFKKIDEYRNYRNEQGLRFIQRNRQE